MSSQVICKDILKLKSDASDIYKELRKLWPCSWREVSSKSQEVREILWLISALKSRTLKLNQFVAQTSFHFHYDPSVECHSDVKNVSLIRAQT